MQWQSETGKGEADECAESGAATLRVGALVGSHAEKRLGSPGVTNAQAQPPLGDVSQLRSRVGRAQRS